MRRQLKYGLPLAILILAFVIMKGLIAMREKPARREHGPRPMILQTLVAAPATLSAEIKAYGRLRSALELELVSEVGGVLEPGEVPFRPGQPFFRGQVLLRVDERAIRYDIASRKSQLLSALATVLPEIGVDFPDEAALWRDYFERFRIEGPLLELPELREEKVKLYLARHAVYQTFYGIRDQELRLEKCTLRAPFDGVLVDAVLREGSTVRAGGVLGRLLSREPEDLELEVALPAAELAWLDRAAAVAIRSLEHPGDWLGSIRRVGGDVDSRTQTLPLYLGLAGPGIDALPAGCFLEARFATRPFTNALRLPRAALHGENAVYLIESGGLRRRRVRIARGEDDTVIVTGGVAAGDTIVVEPLQGVTEGMPAQAANASSAQQEGQRR